MPNFGSAKDLAAILKVHVKTVLKWTRAGKFPVSRASKRCLRYDLDECVRIFRSFGGGPEFN
jgi:predicted site-specific integrase-resolvase